MASILLKIGAQLANLDEGLERRRSPLALRLMGAFDITIDANNLSSSGEASADSLEEARVEAVRGALMIGTEEICQGRSDFVAEVTVSESGRPIKRHRVVVKIEPIA